MVGGLLVVVPGKWLHWRWVNQCWFRLLHLAAIGVVVAQAWLGYFSRLITLESWLLVQTGARAHECSFIGHWLQKRIYFEAPFWVFAVAYTGFALLVLLAWWHFPPRRGSGKRSEA